MGTPGGAATMPTAVTLLGESLLRLHSPKVTHPPDITGAAVTVAVGIEGVPPHLSLVLVRHHQGLVTEGAARWTTAIITAVVVTLAEEMSGGVVTASGVTPLETSAAAMNANVDIKNAQILLAISPLLIRPEVGAEKDTLRASEILAVPELLVQALLDLRRPLPPRRRLRPCLRRHPPTHSRCWRG
jgi:hypothetical protein